MIVRAEARNIDDKKISGTGGKDKAIVAGVLQRGGELRAVLVPGHAREQEDSERSRFARFAKKLVQVPKKEINEKAKEWKRERKRGGSN